MSELVKLPYETKLRELGIYSLYCRQQCGDLIETYKLLNVYYNVDWTKFFSLSPVSSTRGHHAKLYKNVVKINFFTQRCVNMWNSLPEVVVSATNIQLFKQQLDEHWSVIGYGYVQRPGAWFLFYGLILLYNQVLKIIQNAVKSDVKTGRI